MSPIYSRAEDDKLLMRPIYSRADAEQFYSTAKQHDKTGA